MSETVMIVAGETSGELYGALLAEQIRKKSPNTAVIGIGGERMQAAGVRMVSGISSAFGITEAISSISSLKETFSRAVRAFNNLRPSVLVLIDYPDFNLKLAVEARKLKIPVLYYVSPQVWAWRRGRVKKIARLVDRMAVILPFEEEIYRDTGLTTEFVGHPVLDEMNNISSDKQSLKSELGLDPKQPLISLLPGSRPHELKMLLPLLVETVKICREEFPEHQYAVPFAPNTDLLRHKTDIDSLQEQGVHISKGRSLKTLAASDAAVIASGTAALQAALLGVPLVVMYRVFPLTYWLGKKIIKVKWISLVNILSDREVVRELLQSDATAANIVAELRRLTGDADHSAEIKHAYDRVRSLFSGRSASDRVSDMALEMAGLKGRTS